MRRAKKKIDPDLLAQLETAAGAAATGVIQAVVQLRPGKGNDVAPQPDQTERIVGSLLARVARQVGLDPADFNVFPNLGSFVISAPGDYLRALLDQPEVASALANRPGETGPRLPARRPTRPRKPARR